MVPTPLSKIAGKKGLKSVKNDPNSSSEKSKEKTKQKSKRSSIKEKSKDISKDEEKIQDSEKQEDEESLEKKSKFKTFKNKLKRSGKKTFSKLKSFSGRVKNFASTIGTKNCQPPIIDPEMQERRIDRLRKGMKFNYTTANVSRIIKLTKDYTESNCNN